MAAPKGTRPPAAGRGRKKGEINKVTRQLKDMILGALDDAGGQAYLHQQAFENPGPFLALIGKVLPTTIAGDSSAPVVVEVRRTIIKPD
jgi:hypothetical protein